MFARARVPSLVVFSQSDGFQPAAQKGLLRTRTADTPRMPHLSGRAVSYSAKSLPPFAEAPPLGLFEKPPVNPKTNEERVGVWAYKLAVHEDVAQLAREVRARHAHESKQAMKRMPYVGEYSPDELGEVELLDVEALLPPDYRHYLYWLDDTGRPLARWVYNNLPDEVAWEGGEIIVRLNLFYYIETRKGKTLFHRFTPAGYRREEHADGQQPSDYAR